MFFLSFILFVLSLLPTISLGISIHSSEGERFIYLASVFMIFAFVEIVFLINRKINYKYWTFVCVLVIGHAYLLTERCANYRNGEKMVQNIIECTQKYKIEVDELYTINLPAELNGVVMFRNGFIPALKSLVPDLKFNRFINLQSVILEKKYNIQCKEISYGEIKRNLDKFKIPFVPKKTMIIWFTNKWVYFIT